MLPKLDLYATQGVTFYLPVTYKDEDEVIIPLTGYTAKMQVRNTPEATGDPIIDLTTENGGIVITEAEGLIEVIISAENTAALELLCGGYYSLQIIHDTIVEELLSGKFSILPGVVK